MGVPVIGAILEVGSKLIDKLIPDPAQKAEAKYKLLALAQSGELQALDQDMKLALGQINVNLEEAKSDSLFKGGWRPFIGWVCGAACAWNWIGLPVAVFFATAAGYSVDDLAPASLMEMMPVLLGMLGLGTLRTHERVNGVIPKGK